MEFRKQGDEPERYKILERSVADAHFDTIAGDEFFDNAVWDERLELDAGIDKVFKK